MSEMIEQVIHGVMTVIGSLIVVGVVVLLVTAVVKNMRSSR